MGLQDANQARKSNNLGIVNREIHLKEIVFDKFEE